jgi:uncharacterized protein
VSELWRYPVKGLLGESLQTLTLDEWGVVGDRAHAVCGADGKLGSAKTTRRFRRMPHLLTMRSFTAADGSVTVEMADGWVGDVSAPATAARVGETVGEPVTLCAEGDIRHVDAAGVHLVTTASLGWLQARLPGVRVDRRRFRPNILVACDGDGLVEEEWVGAEVRVGSARLRIERRTIRCVTPALAQDDLAFAAAIPSEIERSNEFCFGVYATVVAPGHVHRNDEVRGVSRHKSAGGRACCRL